MWSYVRPRQCIKKHSHVPLWKLDRKEGWVPKNWCVWIVVLEKTPESPLDSKEIKPVNLKGNQPWVFIGRIDAEAKLHYFGDLIWRADSLEKTLMLAKMKKLYTVSISPCNEYSGLVSFMIYWFDLLAVQGTLRSLLQHHNSKASILQQGTT